MPASCAVRGGHEQGAMGARTIISGLTLSVTVVAWRWPLYLGATDSGSSAAATAHTAATPPARGGATGPTSRWVRAEVHGAASRGGHRNARIPWRAVRRPCSQVEGRYRRTPRQP